MNKVQLLIHAINDYTMNWDETSDPEDYLNFLRDTLKLMRDVGDGFHETPNNLVYVKMNTVIVTGDGWVERLYIDPSVEQACIDLQECAVSNLTSYVIASQNTLEIALLRQALVFFGESFKPTLKQILRGD